jgi:ABC-type branched-subunit amino acid transport system substrate-binding protein
MTIMARYALVIGITQNQGGLKLLKHTAADAKAIAAVLREYGKFDHIELLLKPEETTYKALESKILEFLNERAVDQEALIYYSGHGFQSKVFGTNEVFLAPSDCVVELDADDHVVNHQYGLPLMNLSKSVAGANLSSLVMLLDCCNSGYLLEESLLKQTFSTFKSKDYSVFMACRSFEKAWAKTKDPYSVFTGAVLAGLTQDRAEQGEINTDMLFGFLKRTLCGERQEVVRLFIGRSIVLVSYPVPIPLPEPDEINPYQGLRPFTPETAKFFFGRKSETNWLVNKLEDCNFVPVIGASGSGKSSLVMAGLIPRLLESGWQVLEPIQPGEKPLSSLKSAVGTLFLEGWEEIYQVLEQDGLGAISSRLPGQKRVLLVVDQFEEVFTLCNDLQERERFIKCLSSVKHSENQRFVVVMTIRADFLSQCLEFEIVKQSDKVREDENNTLFLNILKGQNLEEAITRPLAIQIQKYKFEIGLLGLILDDVKKGDNCLPLLEFALRELWEQRDKVNNELTVDEYHGFGGLLGVLDREADRIYKDLEADKKGEWVKRIMLRLVRISEKAPNSRQPQSKATLLAMGKNKGEQQKIEKIIERLIKERLLTIDGDIVDLSHEALMQGWGKFAEWLEIDRDFRVWHGQFLGLMDKWQEKNKHKSFLLKKEEIQDAEKWLKEYPQEIHESERLFINHSQRHINNVTVRIVSAVSIFLTVFIGGIYVFNRYASCPVFEGLSGEKTSNNTCFRNLKTSGNRKLFLSSTNPDIEKGIKSFNQEKFEDAKTMFDRAAMGDSSDPTPIIFSNNASARNQDKKLKLANGFLGNFFHKDLHLKLAVVASIDYYEIGAKEVLRGIADAQAKFNENQINRNKKQEKSQAPHPLIEVEIVNDDNERDVAKNVAKYLADEKNNVIGIIGHYASESTYKAEKEVYNDTSIAVISSTSASSLLSEYKKFYRTVQSTEKAAEKYVEITQELKLDSKDIAIVFVKSSEYSNQLKEDFVNMFAKSSNLSIEVKKRMENSAYNIENNDRDFESKILEFSNKKVVLIFSSVKMNSTAIAIAKKINDRRKNFLPKLLISMSLSESELKEKAGADLAKEMTMVRPCVFSTGNNKESYLARARKKWKLEDINWRTVTSYDAFQVFAKAINNIDNAKGLNRSDIKLTRDKIIQQLKSLTLNNEETSGFGVELSENNRSNTNRKYCFVQFKKGESTKKTDESYKGNLVEDTDYSKLIQKNGNNGIGHNY